MGPLDADSFRIIDDPDPVARRRDPQSEELIELRQVLARWESAGWRGTALVRIREENDAQTRNTWSTRVRRILASQNKARPQVRFEPDGDGMWMRVTFAPGDGKGYRGVCQPDPVPAEDPMTLFAPSHVADVYTDPSGDGRIRVAARDNSGAPPAEVAFDADGAVVPTLLDLQDMLGKVAAGLIDGAHAAGWVNEADARDASEILADAVARAFPQP